MGNPDSLGKMLLLLGGVVFFLGLLLIVAPRLPYVGRLPGDLLFRRGSFTLYLPLGTSLLISIGLTLLLNVFLRLLRG